MCRSIVICSIGIVIVVFSVAVQASPCCLHLPLEVIVIAAWLLGFVPGLPSACLPPVLLFLLRDASLPNTSSCGIASVIVTLSQSHREILVVARIEDSGRAMECRVACRKAVISR